MSMLCRAKRADWCISGTMMWRMNGGTCAALHFLPVEWNANPEYFLALADGYGMQLAPAPLIHQLLPQTLRVHLLPLRNGGMPAAMGSGNVAERPYLMTDTDARSYRKKEFAKVLEQHEKEKKDKYLQNCLEMRKDFTPMVYSVDGIAGREARNAEKRLATHLAGKWNREYSQMVYYVRVRMAIAVVRANSLLIRGSRDRQRPRRPLIPDGAALGDWRTWSDR